MQVVAEMEKNRNYWWYAWDWLKYMPLWVKKKSARLSGNCLKNRGDFVPWMKADFYFKPLQNEPRFIEMTKRLKLPV
jgi:hypothetical protein